MIPALAGGPPGRPQGCFATGRAGRGLQRKPQKPDAASIADAGYDCERMTLAPKESSPAPVDRSASKQEFSMMKGTSRSE